MSKLIQRCSIAILIQAVFVIVFQIVLDVVFKIVYIAHYISAMNGFLSLLAGYLGFYYGNTKEFKINCIHVIVTVLIFFLYLGYAAVSFILLLDPQDLKTRVRIVIEEIFDARHDQNETDHRMMDFIQNRLHCCGVNGLFDYGIYYPQSCCAPSGRSCSLTNDNVYTRGCAYEAFFVIYHAEIICTVVMIAFAVAPLVATISKAKQLSKTIEMVRYAMRNDRAFAADVAEDFPIFFSKNC